MLPIYVISPERALRRRERWRRQLEAAGVHFEFVTAIEGVAARNAFDGIDFERFVVNTGRQIQSDDIGSFATHRTLWKICAFSGRPMLITEDGVELKPAFRSAVSAAAALIGRCGLIRMQYEQDGNKTNVAASGDFHLQRFTKVPRGTMCYAISPPAARGLIDSSVILDAAVDDFLRKTWVHRQSVFCLTPYAVTSSRLAAVPAIADRCKRRKTLRLYSLRMIDRVEGLLRRAAFNLAEYSGAS